MPSQVLSPHRHRHLFTSDKLSGLSMLAVQKSASLLPQVRHAGF
jgi:hypothetical protein